MLQISKQDGKLVAAFVAALSFGGLTGWMLNDFLTEETAPIAAPEKASAITLKAGHEKRGGLPVPETGAVLSQSALDATMPVIRKTESVEQTAHTFPENAPRWQKNSKPVALKEGYAKVAIVIDDVGVVADRSAAVVRDLPSAVTLAFLPYGESTPHLAKEAFARGHEIMVHMPMQPLPSVSGYVADPGPGALFTTLSEEEVRTRAIKHMSSLKDISVGANNHMGSAFTGWKEGMDYVLEEVSKEKLMFMDSVTTAKSKVSAAAVGKDIKLLKRDIFLDHSIDENAIRAALAKAERVAKAQGSVIAIGHPHPETTKVLKEWVDTLEEKKLQLVPITTLIGERK